MNLIHLHTHTTYSFLDGYGTAEQYIKRLKDLNMPGMAITDHGNIYAHRDFYEEFRKSGLKAVLGCELYIKNPHGKYYHLTVLAKNNIGYKNLCNLVTLANQEDHFDTKPLLSFEEVAEKQEGLVVLSGCFGDGILHRLYQTDKEKVLSKALWLKETFRDFYIEIQHIDKEEMEYMRNIAILAEVPPVASIDCHYPEKEQYQYEDMMFCIGQKKVMSDIKRYRLEDKHWLMNESEALTEGFNENEINVTKVIFDLCNIDLPKCKPIEIPNADTKLVKMIREFGHRLPDETRSDEYKARYLYELSIITKLGLWGYFVVMADVVNEFKKRGILIGPARGSSAGSLIAYILGITEVDPIKNKLSFERFLDINRKDMPDIDTDFPHEIRGKVIQYLEEKYGVGKVGRLCSFSTYKGSSVFWDIARIHGIDKKISKELSKEIPNLVDDQTDISVIMENSAIQKIIAKYPEFKNAIGLEGQIRQLGKHASGFVVSSILLPDVVSFNLAGDEEILSVDKDRAERMGLLKLDILSLSTLDHLQKVISDAGISNTDLYKLPFDHKDVYDFFNEGKVAGVFQFEGGAVMSALRQFKVKTIDDLAFINAVARPGASNALTGEIKVPDAFKPLIFKGRYFVYQEELMSILRLLNFDWEDVTKFRKMVSKKKVAELKTLFYDKFIEGAKPLMSVDEAVNFWNVINRFGSYGFNKSHAISYAILAYWCMYLKMKYPESFIKHYMDQASDMKRRKILREFIQAGYTYMAYDPQRSNLNFQVNNKTIIGSLLAIKGIGEKKAEKIMKGIVDKGSQKAIEGAEKTPSKYCPWSALDDFGNRYKIGKLPEGEYIIKSRVWEIKDGCCIIEDVVGAEKAYFDSKYVKLDEGVAYVLYISKYKYAKIDSARKLENE